MCWTEITREQYRRDGLRYASDMTDAEWKLIEPLMPARPSARDQPAGDPECNPLHWSQRLPMARAAEGLPGLLDGSVLFLQMARFWLVAHDQ
jgi:hypothetical protein